MPVLKLSKVESRSIRRTGARGCALIRASAWLAEESRNVGCDHAGGGDRLLRARHHLRVSLGQTVRPVASPAFGR
jgi:hypothetical protein